VIGFLATAGHFLAALLISGLLAIQGALMVWFQREPIGRALPLSGFGVPFFVGGMMISASAIGAVT
jgi:chlorophyll synthase